MMRIPNCLALAGVVCAPAAALAQSLELPVSPTSPPVLAPLPRVEVTQAAPAPKTAPPPPPPVQEAPPPPTPVTPPQPAPVLVTREDKGDGLGDKLGSVVGGVAGGAAGAAVAGPVGKFAGGFIGKKLVKGILGGGDDTPEVTAIHPEPAPAAGGAAKPAAATSPELPAPRASPST